MPTYEYACKSCGQHLEAVQSFTDDALTVCPNCGGQLRKVFGNIGIAFKGSGFYKNDSRSSKSSHLANASSGGPSGGGAEGGSSESSAPSKDKESAGTSSSSDSSGGSGKESPGSKGSPSGSKGSSSGSEGSGSATSPSKDGAKAKPSAAAS